MFTEKEIKEFANYLEFSIEDTKEILEIFRREKEIGNYRITSSLNNIQDYIKEYETSWYRYSTWEELLKFEEEQPDDYGLNEEELRKLLDKAIFKLSSGVYIQNVF